MPLSSDGSSIDFIYGVINWKEVADEGIAARIEREVNRAAAAAPAVEPAPVWADGPNAQPMAGRAAHSSLPDDPLELGAEDAIDDQPAFDLEPAGEARLADRLCAARECAEAVRSSEARSRGALYRALGLAYDFAVAAEAAPEDYAEMLDDAGIKAQARAPMTPVVKLVFGAGYDKTRLTEFAAALSYARRHEIETGAFPGLLESFEGGLKGIVHAERRERRPAARPDRTADTVAALRSVSPIAYLDVADGEDEFVLLIGRRQESGRVAVLAPVGGDKALVERAIRKALI